jgi:mRNA-degrading endonuclease toxin of MazEF toxin-antitoxin module
VHPGDLVLVFFPFSYLEEESFKKRPVLVVGATQPGEAGDHAVLVAQVTGSPARVESPGQGDIVVTKWRECGLRKPSVIRSRRLWTPEPRDFAGEPFGKLDDDALTEVLQQVRLLISPYGAGA